MSRSSGPLILGLGGVIASLLACGRTPTGRDDAGVSSAATTSASTATASSPAPSDPYALGFCEVKTTRDGVTTTQRTGGGVMNVTSTYWMRPEEVERARRLKLAQVLLLNCGQKPLVSLSQSTSSTESQIPMRPGRYPIVESRDAKPGSFVPQLLGARLKGPGEIVISAWDASGIKGSFTYSTTTEAHQATFDLRCPQPGNGMCR